MDEIPRGRGLQWLSSWPGGVPKLSLATTLRQPQVVIERLDWGHPANSNTTIAKLSRLLKHNKQHAVALVLIISAAVFLQSPLILAFCSRPRLYSASPIIAITGDRLLRLEEA